MNFAELVVLLPAETCYAKSHNINGEIYFETYDSHINTAIAYVKPVARILKLKYPSHYIEDVVRLHDIGKRGTEFQDMIKKAKKQFIRHEELAFMKWLEEEPELKELEKPQVLAILAHHKTLIDQDSAIFIERYIANHVNWNVLYKKWLEILKTPRENRIDKLFLSTLPLIDVLRTIDILASYTTETVLKQHLGVEYPSSLYEAGRTDLSRELSSLNLKSSEILFKELQNGRDKIRLHIEQPIDVVVEFVRATE